MANNLVLSQFPAHVTPRDGDTLVWDDTDGWKPGVGLSANPTPLSAQGTTQAGALALPAGYQVHEVTGGTGGVRWDGPSPTDAVRYIRNSTGAQIQVYPPVGGSINDAAVNASVAVAHQTTLMLIAASATHLMSVP
jgi:hypothetical protein